MLVILTNEQILSPHQICQGCLLADNHGLPRWRQGKLGCGHCVSQSDDHHPTLYECEMGFRVANIESAIG